MRYEHPATFPCSQACIYRKFIPGSGIYCANEDAEAEKLTDDLLITCPTGRDYYDHMDVFYTTLRTERGFYGLIIISGEPLMVEPALSCYMLWLRKRRRNVAIWKPPVNITDSDEKYIVTDCVYAEFLLGRKCARTIRHVARDLYPLFEKELPEELRKLSETAIEARTAMEKCRDSGLIRTEAEREEYRRLCNERFDTENALIEAAYWALKEKRILRDSFLRIRNRFRGWE